MLKANPESGGRGNMRIWIPAFAGMTPGSGKDWGKQPP